MGTNKGTYLEKVPSDVDFSQEEWDDLSYDMQYYYANEDRQEYLKNKAEDVVRRNREFVTEVKKANTCSVCGEDCYATLVWHHIGDKKAPISELVSSEYGIDSIISEMRKCVLVCSNCHRKHHEGLIEIESYESLNSIEEIASEYRKT